jgi:hypothetical protein
MPPRLVVAAVVGGWLATVGWLVHDKWLPWLRPANEPAFRVELADEVAPEQASWVVLRQDKRVGSAETRFAPHKDGLFEMNSRLRDMDFSMSFVQIKMPSFAATRIVRRDGELVSLTCKAVMNLKTLGADLRIDTDIRGRVEGDQFIGECDFDYGAGKTSAPLEPIKLVSKNAFSPLQPLQKYSALRPGQTWRVANVDPVSDALDGAMRQVVARMMQDAFAGKNSFALPIPKRPKELLAEVQPELDYLTYKGKTYVCRVIVFHGEDLRARTWVDFTDGRVVRQEAGGYGETLVMQRE